MGIALFLIGIVTFTIIPIWYVRVAAFALVLIGLSIEKRRSKHGRI